MSKITSLDLQPSRFRYSIFDGFYNSHDLTACTWFNLVDSDSTLAWLREWTGVIRCVSTKALPADLIWTRPNITHTLSRKFTRPGCCSDIIETADRSSLKRYPVKTVDLVSRLYEGFCWGTTKCLLELGSSDLPNKSHHSVPSTHSGVGSRGRLLTFPQRHSPSFSEHPSHTNRKSEKHQVPFFSIQSSHGPS